MWKRRQQTCTTWQMHTLRLRDVVTSGPKQLRCRVCNKTAKFGLETKEMQCSLERAKARSYSRQCLTSRQDNRRIAINRRSQSEELLSKLEEENEKRWRANRVLHNHNKTFPVASELSDRCGFTPFSKWAKGLSQQRVLVPNHISHSFYLFHNIFTYFVMSMCHLEVLRILSS